MNRRRAHAETSLTVREIGKHGAPSWAHQILHGIAMGTGQPPPSIDLVPTSLPGLFGGVYFPSRNAIVAYDGLDTDVTHGVICHEGGHWRCYVYRCGQPGGRSSCGYHGDHDPFFYRVLGPIYRSNGVTAGPIQTVEGRYPYPRAWLKGGAR